MDQNISSTLLFTTVRSEPCSPRIGRLRPAVRFAHSAESGQKSKVRRPMEACFFFGNFDRQNEVLKTLKYVVLHIYIIYIYIYNI